MVFLVAECIYYGGDLLMNIGICDDDHRESKRIEEFLNGISELAAYNVNICSYDPEEFRRLLELKAKGEEQPNWDIVIMDIEFLDKEYDGIFLTKKLNEVNRNCQVIYLTHILEFAPEVYDTDHCYFVMKNNMELMLPRALNKALTIYSENVSKKPLTIMSGGHKVFISLNDIRYIEKKQRQTVVHTDANAYTCYESISVLSKKLSGNVVRCHGGYLVNVACVTYLGGDKILLDGPGEEIPLGKTYKEQAKQAYLKYWMNRL